MANRFFFIIPVLFSCAVVKAQPKKGTDYPGILKRGAQYGQSAYKELPRFSYQPSADPKLVALRKNFRLDSIAGFGNEASRLINLMHWVHNTLKHDGQNESGIRYINAESILTTAQARNIGVSCGELATVLNECYLAMGWKSRKVYCFPKDSLKEDNDSHVINMVYLSSKKRWVWMDPTNDAYVMDETGNLLGIEEVRERLIQDKPLIVNPDANWNRKSSMTREYYLDIYMAKNLYRFYCPLKSEYDYETRQDNRQVVYVYLNPLDYHKKPDFKTADYFNAALKTTFVTYTITNEKLFWQMP